MPARRSRVLTAAFLLLAGTPAVSRGQLKPSAHPLSLPPVETVDGPLAIAAASGQ